MQFRFKNSLWVICKILGLFVNPLTADDKYSLLNRSNLLQHFQMQLSQKRKTFSEFFFAFSKFRFNFNHLQKKDKTAAPLPYFWSLCRQFSWKKSLLIICNILGLFVNPLTADRKYSLLKTGNLLQDFKIHSSQKWKKCSPLFFAFSKFRFNFERFRKKDEPQSWRILELTDSEKRG